MARADAKDARRRRSDVVLCSLSWLSVLLLMKLSLLFVAHGYLALLALQCKQGFDK